MDPTAYKTRVLHWIDVSTTVVFWIEALLKIVGFSFKLYFSYFTNKVDLAVVVVSTVVLIADSFDARFLKTLRVLRAIKPLRVLTRSMSMLLVFHTLARSLMEMGNVTVLTTMCFLIFAILGVQLFAGMFYSCTDTSVANQGECVGTYTDASGQLVPREWVNLDNNFDNIGQAFLTLFITATLDGYTPAMYMSMATRSQPGLQPVQGSNPAAFLFWFAYITLVAFFVINLYVGVVFYQFQRLKMLSQTGSAVLTASQTGYVEMMKAVFRLKPLDRAPPPTNPIGRFCHHMAYHPWFDNIMTGIIIANVVLLGTTYYGESASFTSAKEHANTAFSSIVILEFVIKLAAMGPRLYWRNNWNKFDVALTVASLIDIITQILAAVLGSVANLSTIKKVMMLLRTLRLFKVMRRIKGLQILMTTLVVSLPSIANVGSLLLLLFFIYAYMGVILLGNIVHGQALDEHANFDNFPTAMLTLFRVAVGDDWTSLMQDCMVQPPDCDPDAGNCGSQAVWLYFFSFYLAVGLIAFNLFTTVVLENFERVQDTEDWKLTPANLDEFCELWAEYDDGTSLIEPKDLETILLRLKPPMGLGRKATGRDIMRFVYDLQIPIVNGKVPFYRTAFELVQRASYVTIPPGELKRKLDRMIKRFLNRHTSMKPDEQMMSFDLALTVMRIQRVWRAKVQRRRLLEERKSVRRLMGLPSSEETAAPAAGSDLEGGQGGVEGGGAPRLNRQASRGLFRALSRAPSALGRIGSLRRN